MTANIAENCDDSILDAVERRHYDVRVPLPVHLDVRIASVAVACSCLVGLSACSRKSPDKSVVPSAQPERPVPLPKVEVRFEEKLPAVGGPPGYVGSKSCQSCHQDEFASWHRSYHRTMTQLVGPGTVRADFGNVVLTNENTRFTLSQTNDEYWVHLERPVQPTGDGAAAASLDARLGLVTGSHHMQVFWLPADEGNAQVGFPFTWLIPEGRWVPRKSTFVRPPEASHPAEIWNFTCSRCHATGIQPRIDTQRHLAETRAAELGIACEACHGPGQRHVEARRSEPDRTQVDPAALRAEIVHPKKIDPARAAQICGFCHSMKWFDQKENWRQDGFRFRPGDDLDETTPIITPSKLEGIPGLAKYLQQHPELLQDYFWPDGMVRVSGRDYNGLVESPCYKGGKFSCLSCHSLHGGDPDGQLSKSKPGDAACLQCHERFGAPTERLAHTRHQAGSSGSDCLNCHMPRTTYGVLKAIRAHQISSPAVAGELATGRPNACNLCHLDKTLAWTAERLHQWFGQAPPELSPEQHDVADSVRLALAGDAGQRALLAWHYGWEPAQKASGETWLLPILAQLLDDPYAAVRCIAERSLRRTSTPPPPGYDYTVEPNGRAPVGSILLQQWNKQDSPVSIPPETLVRSGDLSATEQALARILKQRDDAPVRLRE